MVLSLPVPETMAEVAAAADVETTGELEPLLVPVLPGVPVVLKERSSCYLILS